MNIIDYIIIGIGCGITGFLMVNMAKEMLNKD